MRYALVLAVLLPAAAAAETHRLRPTVGHPTFAVRPPVLTVKPGDVLESESLWGEWYEKAGGKWPGEVGPIAIEGALPGDTLVVEILKVRPNRDTAVSTQGGRFGALVPDSRTAFLNDPFPRGRYVWRIDRERMTATVDLPGSRSKSVTVPLAPMLGRVAVAPEDEEEFGGLWPGQFGGNLDVPDVREGTTVYLPVFHPGALFYFGDGHARQGDGEVCGSGLETSMDVAFRFGLQKKRKIAWPRLEDATDIMVAGSARPLTDALRIAFVELIEWLVADYGFDKADAYQLVSQVATVRVGNVVDPVYTVAAKFPKRYLPERTAAAAPPGPAARGHAVDRGGDAALEGPRGGAAARCRRQGARPAPAVAQRPDPRGLLRRARAPGAPGSAPAHADLRVLSRVPRLPGLDVRVVRHPARHGRGDRARHRAARPAPLLRAQHRRVHRAPAGGHGRAAGAGGDRPALLRRGCRSARPPRTRCASRSSARTPTRSRRP